MVETAIVGRAGGPGRLTRRLSAADCRQVSLIITPRTPREYRRAAVTRAAKVVCLAETLDSVWCRRIEAYHLSATNVMKYTSLT